MQQSLKLVPVAAIALCALPALGHDGASPVKPVDAAAVDPWRSVDPGQFFQTVVDRYRALEGYVDSSEVVQVISRAGEREKRTETQINCEVRDGELHVTTPQSQLLGLVGLDLPLRTGDPARQVSTQLDLWLAPHMTMKFTEQPLREFRVGVEEGFTPTEVGSVTINDRPMVQLELKSGDGASEDCSARFNLFVNPESMLIERIEGEQRLPDGADFHTTLSIRPDPERVLPAEPDAEARDELLEPVETHGLAAPAAIEGICTESHRPV